MAKTVLIFCCCCFFFFLFFFSVLNCLCSQNICYEQGPWINSSVWIITNFFCQRVVEAFSDQWQNLTIDLRFSITLAIQSDWKYIFYHLITHAHAQVLLLKILPLTQLNFVNFFVSGNLPGSLRLDYQPLFRKWSRTHDTRVSPTHPMNKVQQAKPGCQ